MGWTDDLLTGICTDMAAAGIANYDPTTAVEQQTNPISVGPVTDQPDNQIGLQPALITPDPAMSDVVQMVQFWIRGDDAYVKATADAIFDRYEGAVQVTFNGVTCSLIHLHSDAQMGLDQRGRRERALQYDVTATRPTASRPD